MTQISVTKAFNTMLPAINAEAWKASRKYQMIEFADCKAQMTLAFVRALKSYDPTISQLKTYVGNALQLEQSTIRDANSKRLGMARKGREHYACECGKEKVSLPGMLCKECLKKPENSVHTLPNTYSRDVAVSNDGLTLDIRGESDPFLALTIASRDWEQGEKDLLEALSTIDGVATLRGNLNLSERTMRGRVAKLREKICEEVL